MRVSEVGEFEAERAMRLWDGMFLDRVVEFGTLVAQRGDDVRCRERIGELGVRNG